MSKQKFLMHLTETALILLFLGSGVLTATPLEQSPEQQGLFKFIHKVQVTPDDSFQTGSFARINYVPAIDRFVVTFGTKRSQELGICKGAGYAYKEYSLDMEETGRSGTFTWNPDACEANDSGSRMVDNTYYFVHVPTDTGLPYGWRITKYDAVNWTIMAGTFILLEYPQDRNNDPMVAYVNGQLDISAQYDTSGTWPSLTEGSATHHNFFSTDLLPSGRKILDDNPHVCGSSMIYVDGFYYFITADAFLGDLVVMNYDNEWNYLGVKTLIQQAHWSQGVAYDGRFYVSYLNTSQRTENGLPVYLNVHLAAFDRDWNLLDDVAVTSFAPSDNKQPGRPWVTPYGNRLFVSYDQDSIDAVTREEQLKWQAYVAVYEVSASRVFINEFMADNDHTVRDEASDFDDWFELYNATDFEASIGGMYVTDDLVNPAKWQIPNTAIPPHGTLLFWSDEEEEEGPLHTNFKLAEGGEVLALFDRDGKSLIDSVTFGQQTTDISFGRYPDGADVWRYFETSTPGEPNARFRKGDVNRDGQVNVLDVIAVINFILAISPLDDEQILLADCSDDGQVNVLDALGIVNLILGIGTCTS